MRAYGALLRLLPLSFRSEYGDEMRTIFARRLRDTRGPLSTASLWADAVADVAACAARVHLDILQQDLRHLGRSLRRTPGFALTVVVGGGARRRSHHGGVLDHRPRARPAAALPRLGAPGAAVAGPAPRLRVAHRAVARQPPRLAASQHVLRGTRRLSPRERQPRGRRRTGAARVRGGGLGGRPAARHAAALGRTFAPEEDREGAPGTLLLSYGLWHERFGGDPGVLGRKLLLDDQPYQVIGVMPRGFYFPRRETRLWRPLRLESAAFERRDDHWLESLARLRPGVSLEAARAEARLVAAQLERQYPTENEGLAANLVLLRDQVTQQSRVLLLALFGAALGVLLIACTNLASLFLARALERRKELAVRTALGAGRERLLRQLLTESLLLGAAGGLLGVLLALAALPLVARLVPNALPIAEAPPLDLRILAFAALMTLVTAVGFGLAPALRSLGDRGAVGLREGARAGSSGRERLRSLLVVAEVTVSVVLLVSSGLLIRALLRVQSIDPGFDPARVMTLRTTLPMPKYQPLAARTGFCASVLGEVRALPGVASAAYTSFLPFVMGGGNLDDRSRGSRDTAGAGADRERALPHAWLLRDARNRAPEGARRGRDRHRGRPAGGRGERIVRRALLARPEPDRAALPLRAAGQRSDQRDRRLPGPHHRGCRRRRQGARAGAAQRAASVPALPAAARERDGLLHSAGPGGEVQRRPGRARFRPASHHRARRSPAARGRCPDARDDRRRPRPHRAGSRFGCSRPSPPPRSSSRVSASMACSPSPWRADPRRSGCVARSGPAPATS